MNDCPTEATPIAEALYERLGTTAQAAYLYGSVVRGSRHARDLDLLLVVSSVDHTEVYAAIAALQVSNTILIHPTVISPHELRSNPLFRKLVDSSIILWQEPDSVKSRGGPKVVRSTYEDSTHDHRRFW